MNENDKVIAKYHPKLDAGRKPGDTVTYEVGAPGIGRTTYRITHIDKIEGWIYGYLIEDNSRILEGWEVV